MKRDMELWRKISLMLEERPVNPVPTKLKVPDYDQDSVDYHLLLLKDGGYVECIVVDMEQRPLPFVYPQPLTLSGHELAEMMRDDTRWNKAKETVTTTGTNTLDVVKVILTALSVEAAKRYLGLP